MKLIVFVIQSFILMMMSLPSISLDAFYACAQVGHFTKAALRLHITQSALSQRIKNLEVELGITLFIRDRAGIRLTESGQKLLRYCQSKESLELEALTSIHAQSSGQTEGHIRIGGYSSVMRSIVLPKLKPLLKSRRLILKFVIKEMYELPSLLQSGEIDFMIMDYALQREGIVHATMGSEKNVLIQKKNYKDTDVYLDHDEEDLTTVRFLKKKNSADLNRIYLDDIYGIIDGVRMGLGKAVVPLHLIENYSDIEILDQKKSADNPIIVHFYEQPFYSRLHSDVIAALKMS